MKKKVSFYHVFLSFRGETRDNFSCFLHEALTAQGFDVFMDKSDIETGDEVDSRIKEGIRNSMSAIIVFSPDYAASRWCLDELVLILQRMKSSRFFIIPILFDVESKTIKYQLGKYGAALEKHRARHEDKVEMWKEALAEVGKLLGEHVKGAHNIFIKNIVKQFRGKLSTMFPELGLPVQNRSVLHDSVAADPPMFTDLGLPMQNRSVVHDGVDADLPMFSEFGLPTLNRSVVHNNVNADPPIFPELGLPVENSSVVRNSVDVDSPMSPESLQQRPKTSVLRVSLENAVAPEELLSRRVEKTLKTSLAKVKSYSKNNLNIVSLGDVVFNSGYSCFKDETQCMDNLYEVNIDKVKNQTVAFFGVYDYKGGVSSTAEYLKKYLLKNLVSDREFPNNIKTAIVESFRRTDLEYLYGEEKGNVGSTAAIVALLGDQLLVANVGDCRVVASKAGYGIPLSSDHKPNRYDERERIKDAGGFVSWEGMSTDLKSANFDKFQRFENEKYLTIEWPGTWKVENVSVSRGFGYRSAKKYVIATPEIQVEDIHGVSFLIIGNAGLWNVLSNKDAVEIVQNIYDSKAASEKLVQEAYAKGSTEDIRCLVVRFKTW